MVQSERMASVGVLAAGIVHNLRNPLMTVIGFSEIIQLRHPDLDGLDEIVNAGKHLNDMVEDILAKSRQHKDTELVDFNLLLRRELDFMEVDLTFKHKVEKTVALAEYLPSFECAYTDLSQTLGNLLRNAFDAMYDRAEKKLTVRSSRSQDHIILEIGDNGCGIPAENLSSLFDPFHHQGDRGHRRRASGHRPIAIYDRPTDGALRGGDQGRQQGRCRHDLPAAYPVDSLAGNPYPLTRG